MQVFSSDVYFTVVTNALLASQKEYYSDLVALVDLGHSFVVIDEHQHRNLKPNTEPVNILDWPPEYPDNQYHLNK